MTPEQRVRASKFLSLVLRHRPAAASVVLDDGGWVDVDELLDGCAAAGRSLTLGELREVVATNDKQRFVLDEEGSRIRAAQGLSLDIDLGLQPVEAPGLLFHGTVEVAVESILREGLRPMRRRYVHLSGDVETARRVGARRGRPVILVVDTNIASVPFYRAENGVWLASVVPASAISRHRTSEKGARR